MALARRLAADVGQAFGYMDLQRIDDRMSAYLNVVRQLSRDEGAGS